MRRTTNIFLTAITFSLAFFIASGGVHHPHTIQRIKHDESYKPTDALYDLRAWPEETISFEAVERARDEHESLVNNALAITNENSFETAPWKLAGPANIGGRITALAYDGQSTAYFGAAGGGVWKTTVPFTQWTPIFDNQRSLSIGAITVDPVNKNIVYVGTGEAGGSGSVTPGDGIYKSTDKGGTWQHLALSQSERIGKIAINPKNTSEVYVAAVGKYRAPGGERGLYKSINGGATFSRILFVNDSVGVWDVMIDPVNTQRIFATSLYFRRFDASERMSHSGALYFSSNGGASWTNSTTNLPNIAPADVGRIKISYAPSKPAVMYALVARSGAGSLYGVYKSIDAGLTWTQLPSPDNGNDIFKGQAIHNFFVEVLPGDDKTIFIGGIDVWKSTDGGSNWQNITNAYSIGNFDLQHPDQQAMAFVSGASERIILANDGGIFLSSDVGSSWQKVYGLPITQFYAFSVDVPRPYRMMGGAQDNNSPATLSGPTNDWRPLAGGDGAFCAFSYLDSSVFYTSSQYGNIYRYALSGGTYDIDFIIFGSDFNDNGEFIEPLLLHPKKKNHLLFCRQRVYYLRNDSAVGLSSNVLTGTTLTALTSASSDTGIIATGDRNGKIYLTKNFGGTWVDVSSSSFPQRAVNRIAIHPTKPTVMYATFSGYGSVRNHDQRAPHVFTTTNSGTSWTNISSNLPDAPANAIAIDNLNDSILYLGTDLGVYRSSNRGASWQAFGTGLPNQIVTELIIIPQERILVASTLGRSSWKISLSTSSPVAHEVSPLKDFSLEQNFPNPGNQSSVIRYRVPDQQRGIFEVRDALGRLCHYEILSPSHEEISFDMSSLASGIYYYTLRSGNYFLTRKMEVNR